MLVKLPMRANMRKAAAATAIATLVLGLAACGSDDATKTDKAESSASSTETAKAEVKGTIAGAGASSQKSAAEAWMANFQSANPDATVTYDPVGSGAGIAQFLKGAVAFAGSDEAMSKEEITQSKDVCGGEEAIDLPVYVSPVAIVFNLSGVKTLNLDPEVIADIFAGNIKKWNDPKIAATNAGVTLPDLAIVPVHRADKSGTTENFTDYLAATAPNVWTHKPDKEWPIAGGEAGDKTAGMIQVVKAAEGTIGYADASQAADLGTVALKVGDGYQEYSPEASAKIVDASPVAPDRSANDLALAIDRLPKEAGSYPLVLVSYYAVCQKYDDAEQGNVVKAYLNYVVSEEGQKAAADAAGSAPISMDMRDKIVKAIDAIKAGK